ncbi:PDR/VanB family oxidoreductase [Streptomyces sp. NPDC059248]|uniref:PDR/VanB family oxidoreductase n=1 Tax=Streptomyces sp. NPDC059248 TaxID=3346791 RepID=UPI0036CF6C7A
MLRRIRRSPLWPLPALAEPVSGRTAPETRRTTPETRRVVVAERATVADGVVRLRLEAAAGAPPLPPWEPGAHIDLVLPSGPVRQYSLCGDPADTRTYTVAVRLAATGAGGSREVHQRLAEGTEIEVRGPRNRFPLVPSASYVFVAGGIGITPVLPMLRAADAAGARWRLLYRGRSRASMPFADEVERLGAPGGTGRVTVSAGDESGRPDLGFLTGLGPETAVYCCGPDGLMAAVTALLPADRPPRRERFTAGVPAPGGTAFDVELRRSGRTVRVAPGRSVLAAVREVLPDVAYSCRQGFCGTCRQRVLSGTVDHRDDLLTDAEREDSLLICVSRGLDGKLVLDL